MNPYVRLTATGPGARPPPWAGRKGGLTAVAGHHAVPADQLRAGHGGGGQLHAGGVTRQAEGGEVEVQQQVEILVLVDVSQVGGLVRLGGPAGPRRALVTSMSLAFSVALARMATVSGPLV